ncbi:MAG TPA: Ig-like domain repeat protein [Bryobacteraceae bacterium]|nr:Ig-like domain repeat protein [Bryobacteraceae bacterium]
MRVRKANAACLGTILCLGYSVSAYAQWTSLAHAFPGHPETCVLLTNGDAMCHEYGTNHWHRLTPDNNGSYANGTWDSPPIADMPQGRDTSNVSGTTCNPCTYAPTYFSSAVLPDGRVVVIGGEYNAQTGNNQVDTNIGFLYDPKANTWSTQLTEPFGTGNIGDAQSVILQNGTMLLANINNTNLASFDPSTLTFTAVNPTGKLDRNDEEGWTILPDGKVLTVDAITADSFEIYDPATQTWGNSGSTAGVSLSDTGGNCNSQEIGPAVSRPDGTIINFTGNPAGQNAVYTISSGTWAHNTNMDFPSISSKQYGAADAPASLLPNGNVLVQSSPVVCRQVGSPPKYSIFNTPSHFFEWDGTNLTQVSDPPSASSLISYQGRMLLLPTGEVLFTAYDQNITDVAQIYSNGGAPQDAWRPIVDSVPSVLGLGNTYVVSGRQFNGFSQGASYGDDAQMATNYPLVRIRNNGSGHVFYARTHDHSRMGVEAVGSSAAVSTSFDVPSGMETGASQLFVVTNGIPSLPQSVSIEPATTLAFTGASATTSDFNDPALVEALLKSGGSPVANKTITFTLGSATCSAVTGATGTAGCMITPQDAAGVLTLTATFTSDGDYAGSSASTPFTITKEQTALAFTASGAVTADFDDPATVQAQLTTDGAPLPGKSVTFTLGTGLGAPTCSAVSDPSGNATCTLTPNQPAGMYTLSAAFGPDAFYVDSSTGTTFTVTKEQTTLKITSGSATVIANGHTATFSATLKEDGITPISGRTVAITLGSGGSAQTCSGATDVTGLATCSILVNQPLGPNTVAAKFAGDGFYLPANDSESVLLFAFLAQGSMVVGNLNAAPGGSVEFWGAQWAKLNSLSAGPAPSAFKGFAGTAPQSCGGGWTSAPGDSSNPPATVPSYMGVIASSSIAQAGSTISGNVPMIVVVKTNSGYGPSSGHAGTGAVVAVFCH